MSLRPLLDISDIETKLQQLVKNSFQLRAYIKELQKQLNQAFLTGVKARELIHLRSCVIDCVLKVTWLHHVGNSDETALIAVGGYGRQQLHPYSDIDILILSKQEITKDLEAKLISFLTYLWDLGLEIGHSLRSLDNCLKQAKDDLSIYTNLLENRLICGDENLFSSFKKKILPPKLWGQESFFSAKLAEQGQRHKKYNETAYLLEPDIKNSPGGLRDINTIGWLTIHYFSTADLNILIKNFILNNDDLQKLIHYQNFLWDLRYASHLLSNRKENRLFFDQQTSLAKHFGYKNTQDKLAVEQFMKDYFIAAKEVRALNEVLTQYFLEKISLEFQAAKSISINKLYEVRANYLAFKPEIDIKENPQLILDVFLSLGKYPQFKGLQAKTSQQILESLHLINADFREQAIKNKLFLNIIKQSKDIYNILRLMNRYKVLGHYLPEYDHVIGQSQYDLFHLYTVDQHTLFVIRNLQNFRKQVNPQQFPLCNELMPKIEQLEILYLAALFHDIGKGRRGDHSKIGSQLAAQFCKAHGLEKKATQTICWLVKDHLLMSFTAQKKDINDPEVISKFAKRIKNLERLNFLYLLTVADIYATNENLWNSWKDSLLKHLYKRAADYLIGLPKLDKRSELIAAKQQSLRSQLQQVYDAQTIEALFQKLGDTYFYRETEEAMLWHILGILNHKDAEKPLILTRTVKEHGASEIFVYTEDRDNLFATTTAVLDKLHLNVVEARIITSKHGYSLDTYSALDESNKIITQERRLQEIGKALTKYHSKGAPLPSYKKRRIPSILSHFVGKTKVSFRYNKLKKITEMTIISVDRPGLLARMGRAFVDEQIRLKNAKIVTLGDRVEDVFQISDRQNQAINDRKRQIQLRKRVYAYLDELN